MGFVKWVILGYINIIAMNCHGVVRYIFLVVEKWDSQDFRSDVSSRRQEHHLLRRHTIAKLKSKIMSKDIALHWFRKGLRLHDNPALVEACGSAQLFPVFCLDPHFADPDKVGVNRYSFLLSSLNDLDKSLRASGSRLFVLKGKPEQALVDFVQKMKISKVTFEADTEPYAKKRDSLITTMLHDKGTSTSSHSSHTLHPLESYIARCHEKKVPFPSTYAAFCKLFEQFGRPPADLPPPNHIPPFTTATPTDAELTAELWSDAYNVPTLQEMGYGYYSAADYGAQLFPGGEQEALRRLQAKVGNADRADWVRSFEKPKTSPNSLEPSTTVSHAFRRHSAFTLWSFLFLVLQCN